MNLDEAMKLAYDHHTAGRLPEAEQIYRQILAQYPRQAEALHRLGFLAGQAGRMDIAIELIERAISVSPGVAEYHSNLGEMYRRLGQTDKALANLRRATEIQPEYAPVYYNLGILLSALGRNDEAMAAYMQGAQRRCEYAELYRNLGMMLMDRGRLDDAIGALAYGLQLKPQWAEVRHLMGMALLKRGRLDEAVTVLRAALELKPDAVETLNALGIALGDQDKYDEAIGLFQRAIEIDPRAAVNHYNLGVALRSARRQDEAARAYHQALELQPDLGAAAGNLAAIYIEQGKVEEAIGEYRKILAIKPDALNHSNLVGAIHYHPDYDAQAILAEARRWDAMHARPLAGEIRVHQNDRNPDRKLRVGYISPDLRQHVVGQTLLRLFSTHDRSQVQVIGYCDVVRADDMTRRLGEAVDEWHLTARMPDADLAEKIRRDRIDILADPTLHTAANRLLVLARKPAPIQLTLLGPPATTGLSTMDCRITDPYVDPPGVDADYSERSIRLKHSFWCYSPWTQGAVGELPAMRTGFVTFGCINNFAKVSRPAMKAFARVLKEVAGSRLILRCAAGSHVEGVMRTFASEGVDPGRVRLVGYLPGDEFVRLFGEIDISLDPFPYNGHTSSLDSLWMGVPVITLSGRTGVGRGGASILTNMGMPEFIAHSEAEYASIAVEMSRNLEKLAEYRRTLRSRLEASPLMDATGFTRELEGIYRTLWREWVAR